MSLEWRRARRGGPWCLEGGGDTLLGKLCEAGIGAAGVMVVYPIFCPQKSAPHREVAQHVTLQLIYACIHV